MDSLRQLLNTVSTQALRAAYYLRLGRELGSIQAQLASTSLHECHEINELLKRHLERGEAGATMDEAYSRARSPNVNLHRVGVAQWLAAAFLETRNSSIESLRMRHQDITRVIRQLQQRVEAADREQRLRAEAAQKAAEQQAEQVRRAS